MREAAVSDDGLTAEVFRAAAQSYAEVGWLEPAVQAYTLANDRNGVAEIADQWLDAGLFEEAAIALDRVGLPITAAMLDRYESSCSTNGWFLHATAAALIAENR